MTIPSDHDPTIGVMFQHHPASSPAVRRVEEGETTGVPSADWLASEVDRVQPLVRRTSADDTVSAAHQLRAWLTEIHSNDGADQAKSFD